MEDNDFLKMISLGRLNFNFLKTSKDAILILLRDNANYFYSSIGENNLPIIKELLCFY